MQRLHGRALEQLEEHLLVCEECRQRVVEGDLQLAEMREVLREFNEETTPPKSKSLLPVAAGLAGLLLIPTSFLFSRNQEPTTTIHLQSQRSSGSEAIAKAGGRMRIEIDSQTVAPGSVDMEVVNESGQTVWAGKGTREGAKVSGGPMRLAQGHYYVRLVDKQSRDLLSESSLLVAGR